MTAFLARQEHFPRVGSTNDVVRDWLAAGTPEVCLAVAAEQTAGRGRAGRSWQAPPDAALLLSLGFRPAWLEPERAWRLGATASLAMAVAAEQVAGLSDGRIRLKWPNDLVVEDGATGVRKLAGVLGESRGLGTPDPQVVVGLGINAGWRRDDFPSELADGMTSLHDVSGGRRIEPSLLLAAFLAEIEPAIERLRGGAFDAAAWTARQLTTGRDVRLERPDGTDTVRALGVDSSSGALLVADASVPTGVRPVLVGEIGHVRLAEPAAARV